MQTTPEARRRRSRYVRDRKDVPKLVLGQRDIDILTTVFDFRFLGTDQIAKLVKGDHSSVKKRLGKLWRAYFLKRIFLPRWRGRPMPSSRAIYAIDQKALPVLQEFAGKDPKLLRDRLKQGEVGELYLRHALMISNFRTILTLAAEKRKDLELLFFLHDKSLEDRFLVRGKRYAVIPDGFFGLKALNRPEGENKRYFFLEADRSTMSNRRFLNKMRAYWLWWKTKGHQRKFGIKNFIVLTLTISKERATNLREVALQVKEDGKQEGSGLFWFSEESQISLDDPQAVFNKIWSTGLAQDRELHSILE